jgi:K+-sensing histidine kinase KdpD
VPRQVLGDVRSQVAACLTGERGYLGLVERYGRELFATCTTILLDQAERLARNAIKAMPDGGRLVVSGQLLDGVYQLRVADTGRGMSAEERDKLFHPFKSFFDEGSGLGMAIVYRIVQEHGGRLLVDSAPGQGTVITAELPVGHAPPAAAPWEGAARGVRAPARGPAV